MATSSIKVHLRGGLGNQLFQYAAGFAKATELGLPLVIDARQLPSSVRTTNGISSWPEQISEFNNGAETFLYSDRASLARARVSQLQRIIGDKAPTFLSKWGIYANERNGNWELFRQLAHSSLTINAYCNSPKYFEPYQNEIRYRVADLVNPTEEYLAMYTRIAEDRPVAIHLRLGDYKNLESIYGTLSGQYFAKSVEIVRKLNDSQNLWLFSDEPELAYELLKESIPELRKAPLSENTTGLETLLLMSRCHGLVASNSSFSWWSAFLMEQSMPIIFPRPFFASGSLPEPQEFLLSSWIQIGR